MDSKDSDKYLYTHKRKAVAQLKRRDTYNQMSPDKKELLLLARRMKIQSGPEQPPSPGFSPTVPRQTALTIREPLPPVEKDVRTQPSADTSANKKKKGKDICSPFLINETDTIKSSGAVKEATDCMFERNLIVTEEDLLLQTKLNTQQRVAYDTILKRIFCNKSGAFFIDGPGGTGKTFLYRALLAAVRSRGFVALATASSGVAASILPGGRTAHSRFKFPIEIDKQFSCNISKQDSLAALIRDAKLIVWDEVSMAKKGLLEAFDILLKDLMDTNILFGGKVIVLGGNFRQTLPVVRGGKKR